MPNDWSAEEVAVAVKDYFEMLRAELSGAGYNKSAHRRELSALLSNRSETAIDRKHMNISAILEELGHPWIEGYKPYHNYQRLLADGVLSRLVTDEQLSTIVARQVDAEVSTPIAPGIEGVLVEPPSREPSSERGQRKQGPPLASRVQGQPNYLEREARNRSLGLAGEEFVLQFEAQRLHCRGLRTLADRVEHVSQVRGDGLGYDILSFEPDGRERLIEVKTTSFGKRTPFFVSRNEVRCSDARAPEYHLYRLFSFHRDPRCFILPGAIAQSCELDPTQFVARVA